MQYEIRAWYLRNTDALLDLVTFIMSKYGYTEYDLAMVCNIAPFTIQRALTKKHKPRLCTCNSLMYGVEWIINKYHDDQRIIEQHAKQYAESTDDLDLPLQKEDGTVEKGEQS